MENRVTFDQLEGRGVGPGGTSRALRIVRLVFDTDRFGYFQVSFCEQKGIIEKEAEPSLMMFSDGDREYIEQISTAVWWLVYESGARERRDI